ncbi:hypothetical protein [Xanthobacter flavus]|uniref:hypothetical protein n=1 Tax=Xanthobacter flavus TaxID=281 RepID=UPI00372810D5
MSAPVSIIDLESWHCRRVVQEAPALYCGQPKAFGTSWCEACCAKVYSREGLERIKFAAAHPRKLERVA